MAVDAVDMSSPVGKWKTIDDATGQPKSLVEIIEKDGMLEGKIVELFRAPTEDQNPLCKECEGDKKDQPIKGMVIMSALKKERQKWTGGKILDPKTGKVYNCYLKLVESGKKLEMRGFIGGISLLGRTQIWERQ
jgi:uncharacterized protein (DUF2147 family)